MSNNKATTKLDAEIYLSKVIDNSPHAMMAFSSVRDINGQIVDFEWTLVNRKAENITRRQRSDLIGSTLLVEMPGTRQEKLFDLFVEVVETGNPLEHEHYYRHELVNSWLQTRAIRLDDGLIVTFVDISKLKRPRSKSIKKRTEIDKFFTLSLDLMCIADTDGHFIKVNPAWENTLGYSVEELEGKFFLDFVHPDDIPATLNAINQLAARNPILNFTNRYRHKDGSYRFIEWRSYSQGKLIYAAASDITRRKKIETYQSHLTAIIESSRDGIISKNLEGIITSWNTGAQSIYGYTAEEMIGQSMLKLISPDLRTDHISNMEKIMRGEYVKKHETIRLRNDGSPVTVALTMSPIIDQTGKITGISTINQDITDLKQAQEALFESEQRYRSVVTAMTEGVVLQARDGTIQACNAAAECILGLTADQMMGLTSIDPRWRSIHEDGSPFPGETHPAMVALQTGKPLSNIIMGVHKPDNSLTWISVNAQPLHYPDEEQPYAVIATFVDITRRKEAQQREFQMALEQENMRLLTTFIQNAAHEFRTPLAIINSSSYLLTRITEPEQRVLKASQIQNQVHHITNLVDKMLQVTRLEASIPSFSQVSIPELLQHLCHTWKFKADDLVIYCEFDPSLPPVNGSRELLQEAIEALFDNARRFGPATGSINITASQSSQYIIITIQDQGSGIASDKLPHIFETFWRDDTAHSTPGIGLGLSIALKIVQLHGGAIDVESEPGKGSSFSIYLPLSL